MFVGQKCPGKNKQTTKQKDRNKQKPRQNQTFKANRITLVRTGLTAHDMGLVLVPQYSSCTAAMLGS